MVITPDELIVGYLENRLDAAQTAAFKAWLDESPENKQLLFEMKAVYSSGRPLPDAELSLTRLCDKLNALPPTTMHNGRRTTATHRKRKSRKIGMTVVRYVAAASIAALLTAGLMLRHIRETQTNNPQTVSYRSGNGLSVNTLTLPDGTVVTLGNSTHLDYNTDFGTVTRELKLEGEAFFEVAKMADKPFIVHAKDMNITALGTKFNVMAYPRDTVVTATLVEGSIKVEIGQTDVDLLPNEHALFNVNARTLDISKVDTQSVTRWTTGYYVFENETFANIVHRLSNLYGIDIQIKSKRLAETKFNATFYSGQKITDILSLMGLMVPFKYADKTDKIIIK